MDKRAIREMVTKWMKSTPMSGYRITPALREKIVMLVQRERAKAAKQATAEMEERFKQAGPSGTRKGFPKQ